MQNAEDFDAFAAQAVWHEIGCPADDKFTSSGSPAGPRAFGKAQQPGDRRKDARDLPIGG